MLNLKIPNFIFERMLQQARAEAPTEACGILAGRDDVASQLYPMTNADQSSDHFMMKPDEQFRTVKAIRSAGLRMLAIYHSHPETPARPSAEDIRLALTPDVIYVILSLQGTVPAVKGFRIENGTASEVPVAITKADPE